MPQNSEYEPFAGIIQKGLSKRRAKGACARNPEYAVPTYVVDMCKALTAVINERSGQGLTVHAVLRLEGTCTGADYHQKFAMRCHRLAHPDAA
ncbi:hypothetical protein [Pseudomonas syringae]|uniref:hypothetical protein n=1 Tax=Pseudomonas syringae TaxID=317 RepID=UPI001F1E2A76|nr:hypothetical protein [Pseudomonas syringae]MCF5372008.1 hypothetical protein [Pseudomonas syringae]